MTAMTIIPVDREHLFDLETALRNLANDLGDGYHLTTAGLEAGLFGDSPVCHGLLAYADKPAQLAGAALFSPQMSTMHGSPGAYVSDLWVNPTLRGQNIGVKLLAVVAGRSAELWQAGYLRLVAYEDNPLAIKFYQRLGFVDAENQRDMKLNGAALEHLIHHPILGDRS